MHLILCLQLVLRRAEAFVEVQHRSICWSEMGGHIATTSRTADSQSQQAIAEVVLHLASVNLGASVTVYLHTAKARLAPRLSGCIACSDAFCGGMQAALPHVGESHI